VCSLYRGIIQRAIPFRKQTRTFHRICREPRRYRHLIRLRRRHHESQVAQTCSEGLRLVHDKSRKSREPPPQVRGTRYHCRDAPAERLPSLRRPTGPSLPSLREHRQGAPPPCHGVRNAGWRRAQLCGEQRLRKSTDTPLEQVTQDSSLNLAAFPGRDFEEPQLRKTEVALPARGRSRTNPSPLFPLPGERVSRPAGRVRGHVRAASRRSGEVHRALGDACACWLCPPANGSRTPSAGARRAPLPLRSGRGAPSRQLESLGRPRPRRRAPPRLPPQFPQKRKSRVI